MSNSPPAKWNWTELCGSDDFEIWSPSRHDFGLCFQYLFFHIPILGTFGILSTYYFGLKTHFIPRSKCQKIALHARSLISLAFVISPIIEIFINIYKNKVTDNAWILLNIVQPISWGLHFLYVLRLRNGLSKHPRGPILMCTIWSLVFALTGLTARSQYLFFRYTNQTKNGYVILSFGFDCFYVILQIAYTVTLIPGQQSDRDVSAGSYSQITETQPLINSEHQHVLSHGDPHYLGVAMEYTHCLSRVFFTWVHPLIKKGVKERLTTSDDLYDLPTTTRSEYNCRRLAKYLDLQNDLKNTKSPPSNHSLFQALHKCYGREFYSLGIFKLIADCCGFAGPILLNRLVSFIENKSEDIKWGYIYAAGLIISTSIEFVTMSPTKKVQIKSELITAAKRAKSELVLVLEDTSAFVTVAPPKKVQIKSEIIIPAKRAKSELEHLLEDTAATAIIDLSDFPFLEEPMESNLGLPSNINISDLRQQIQYGLDFYRTQLDKVNTLTTNLTAITSECDSNQKLIETKSIALEKLKKEVLDLQHTQTIRLTKKNKICTELSTMYTTEINKR